MPPKHRTTFDYVMHNAEDRLGLGLTQAQKEGLREHVIRTSIFKRQINSSPNPVFPPKERHAIEIFLRSGCVDVTSNLPTLVGSFEEGDAGFALRNGVGGYKQKRMYAQVVEHPERNARCQVLKNQVGWTAPFNYSSLVPAINVNDKNTFRRIQKAVREREYSWKRRREAGKVVRSPSGSPYASNDEQPRQQQKAQQTLSLDSETARMMKHALDSEESPNTYNFQKYLQKYNFKTQSPGFSGGSFDNFLSQMFKNTSSASRSPKIYSPSYDPQTRLNSLLKNLPPLQSPSTSLATTVKQTPSPSTSLATTVKQTSSSRSTSNANTNSNANSFNSKLQSIFRRHAK